MLSYAVKLRFPRVKRVREGRSREASENQANAEKTKTSSRAEPKDEYLTNKNLSIMTDTQLETDVVDYARLRRKKQADARTNSSSSTDSQDSYILISSEEMPVDIKEINWEYVERENIARSVLSDCDVKKYCSPRCSSAWFLKIRREILKNCRKKIYPMPVNG